MDNARVSTLELAKTLNVSVQTIRRTAHELGITPQKSGKTFVFTQVQSAQIANKLRRHIQHSVAENDAKTENGVSEIAKNNSNGLFGAINDVAGFVSRQEVSIDIEEYSTLVSKSAKLDLAQEQIELYKRRIDVLETEIERLRSDLDQAREDLYKTKYRPLTWRERLFGRPMLPEKSGD